MLRVPRRLLTVALLVAVSMRVFTGAAEAQISFTSLVTDTASHQLGTDYQKSSDAVLNFHDAEHANPTPDKQHSTVTYKKYLTPEKSLAVVHPKNILITLSGEGISYKKLIYAAAPIWNVRANAPPKTLFVAPNSFANTSNLNISWESSFGTSTIDNGTWGLSRL